MNSRDAALADEMAVIDKMIADRKSQLASCERMLELLQPEWDRFEARTGHDLYVARDYADHFSAARKYRKEIAALTALRQPDPAGQGDVVEALRAHGIIADADVDGARTILAALKAPANAERLLRELREMVRLFPEAYDVLTNAEFRSAKGDWRSLIDQQSNALQEIRQVLAALEGDAS